MKDEVIVRKANIAGHLGYLRYVLRHKWYVALECFKAGLFWRGIIHDWSKFLPDEWFAYANHFYGRNRPTRQTIGYSKVNDQGDAAFDYGWLVHQKRNKHHWQWWILQNDEDGLGLLVMPEKYRQEMLADWRGAGRAQGYGDNTPAWYLKNRDKMILHQETRSWVESALHVNTAEASA